MPRQPISTSRVDQPLEYFGFRLSFPKADDGDDAKLAVFKALHETLSDRFKAWGAKFIFQLEMTKSAILPIFESQASDDQSEMSDFQIDAELDEATPSSFGDESEDELDLAAGQVEPTVSGPTRDNYHFQGYLRWPKKVRASTLGKSLGRLFPGIDLRVASNAGRERLKMYCMKADTRQDGPWADKPLSQIEAENPAAYDGSDQPKTEHLWEHQQDVVHVASLPPDNRRIIVFWDPEGKTGKTTVSNFLSDHFGSVTLGWSKASDALYMVSKTPGRKVYVWDLSRTKPGDTNVPVNELYTALESVKNGRFFSTKYETVEVKMRSPHIFVFTNTEPDMTKLSKDRFILAYLRVVLGVERWCTKVDGKPCFLAPGYTPTTPVPFDHGSNWSTNLTPLSELELGNAPAAGAQ